MRVFLSVLLFSTLTSGFKPLGRMIRNRNTFMIHDHLTAIHSIAEFLGSNAEHSHHAFLLADSTDASTAEASTQAAASISPYSKVDRTGFIGSIAEQIENAITFGHKVLEGLGIKNTYGYAIVIFTLLVKALTLPLTSTQLQSTNKMQAIAPFQQKIAQKYNDDPNTKNQVTAMLFAAAEVVSI